jgi:cysteine synthase A
LDFTADPTLDWVNQFAAWALPLPQVTPLIEDASSLLKLETLQISGTAKYRVVHARLVQAINDGQIHPGSILMGVGLGSGSQALVEAARRLGLKVEIHAPTASSPSTRRRFAAAGAQVIPHPGARTVGCLLDLVRWRSRRHGHWFLDPSDLGAFNDAYESLGQELVIQLYRRCKTPPRYFLCPVASGRLIQGVGRRLKQAFPDLTTVGVILGDDPVPPADAADRFERAERDSRVLRRKGVSLGVGGTACSRVARQRNWGNAVILAPESN